MRSVPYKPPPKPTRNGPRTSYKSVGAIPLHIEPLTLAQANNLVLRWHRHHGKKQTHRFSVGVFDDTGVCHGAAIVDRPANAQTDQYHIAEVSRLVTDATPNACSMLYTACARAAKSLGYQRIQTFILESESGASLRAAGWMIDHIVNPGSWDHPSRKRAVAADEVGKTRWSKTLNPESGDSGDVFVPASQRACAWCGRSLAGRRGHAVTCSARCRVARSRKAST